HTYFFLFSGWNFWVKSVSHPTEPPSKLTLYYHMPSIQCCAVRVQSITESKKEKEEGEIKQQGPIYPFIYVLKSSEARRQII
ncbi:MAG TPA: hypothetical protein VFY68_04850, partial [Nitrososphaeraceae archaeon]|nr:hypothetical protein [Nitrososphaeraceae archaeon]